jgi:hypothetical protein
VTEPRDTANGAAAQDAWWLNGAPALFAGLLGLGDAGPGTGEAPKPGATSPTAAPIAEALKRTQAMFESLVAAYLKAWAAQRPGQEWHAWEEVLQGRLAGMADQLSGQGRAFAGQPDLRALAPEPWGPMLEAIGQALRPLSTNLERAYGGLADAFGVAPLRSLQAASRDMALATLARRRAQADYLEVVLGAAGKGLEALTARLAAMSERGESIDSLLGLVRAWASTMDHAMHEAMQSPRALQASAALLRAAARSRREQQRIVAILGEALDVPTRAEMDEAWREIQELKRELRRSRKASANGEAAPVKTRPRGSATARPKRASRSV